MESITNYTEIKNLLQQGIECWEKAGEMLIKNLDAGASLNTVSEATGIALNILEQLERIGRKQVIPRLLISDYPAARAMEKLPYSEQERLQRDTVPLIVSADGKIDVLMVKPDDMTPNQVKQAFCKGHIRTAAEQRAWLADQQQRVIPAKTTASLYTVGKGEVVIHAPCTLTRGQLARILADIS